MRQILFKFLPFSKGEQYSPTRLANLPKVTLILRGGAKIHFTDSRAHTLKNGDAEQFCSNDLRFLESKGNHCGWNKLRGFTEETLIHPELYILSKTGQRGIQEKDMLLIPAAFRMHNDVSVHKVCSQTLIQGLWLFSR